MRIAYGVMGYGRGHAMRTGAVLPALMAEHEVIVLAGGDAHEVLAPQFPTVRIPTLGYVYDDGGHHSVRRTMTRNLAPMRDLLLHGPEMTRVEDELRERDIDLVISDSEAWTHRAAERMRIPRISFDHVGIIAWCKPHFPPDLWMKGMRDAAGYRMLMGDPQRILISSFYPAEPRLPGTRIIGPLLRDVVVDTPATDGDYLLVYLNKGEHLYRPNVDRALRLLDMPVVVYGTPYRGRVDNLDFRAPDNNAFVHDLAGCRAVLSTAGNQLLGEAIHFGKPVLTLPESAFEQRLNSYMVERMGVGMRGDLHRLTPSDIDRFLGNDAYYRSNMRAHARNGRVEAIDTLQQFIDELRRDGLGTRRSWRRSSKRSAAEKGIASRRAAILPGD